MCLSYFVLLNVYGEDSTVKLWAKIGSLYQSKSLVNKLFLQKKLFHLIMDENDTVTEHLNVYNTLVSQITYVGIKWLKKINVLHYCVLCQIPGTT